MGYVTQRSSAPPAFKQMVAGLGRPARRALAGPLTITITHDGLGALGEAGEQLSFEDGVDLALSSLDDLWNKASDLYDKATDTTQQGIGEQVMKSVISEYSTLTEAITDQDVKKLQRIQHALDEFTKIAEEELMTARIKRFILAVIAPPLALASPATIEALTNKVLNHMGDPPKAPGDQPIGYFLGGGAAVGSLMAFMSTWQPRAAVGGAVVGALFGLGVRYALKKIGDAFTF